MSPPNPVIDQVHVQKALRDTVAVILAGGRGSRLGPLTANIAKPAMHFAGKFRLIDFPLSNCMNSGIRKVGVVTQYKAHHLIQHVHRGWGWMRAEHQEFVEVWPAQQQTDAGTWYLGTADAVYQNLPLLEPHEPGYVLILGGDHVYKQDYSVMLAEHVARGADVTISCVEVPIEQASSFGVVSVDDGDRIVGFLEKPDDPPSIPGDPERAFASTGIYIFSADFLFEQLRLDAADPASSRDFGKDILPRLVDDARMYAHRFSRSCVLSGDVPYWRDVGTLDAYWEASLDLTKVVPDLDLYDVDWPIWTFQQQRAPAKFVFDNDGRRGQAVASLVSEGCIVSGATVRRSLLSSGVRIHSWAVLEDCVVLPGADVARHAKLRRVIVDAGCYVPRELEVGYDAASDALRFHRTEGGVVLITQPMIDALSLD